MDYRIFRLINDLAGQNAWLDHTMVLTAKYAPVLFVGVLLWLWGVSSASRRAPQSRLAVGRALLAAAGALALGQVITWLFPRPRPFITHPVHLLIALSSDPSFPSDHALAAFAIAGALVPTHRWLSLGLFVLGGLLSLARVFVGTHYPLDVLGGAVLGGVIGGLVQKTDALVAPIVRLGGRATDALWHRVRAIHHRRPTKPSRSKE